MRVGSGYVASMGKYGGIVAVAAGVAGVALGCGGGVADEDALPPAAVAVDSSTYADSLGMPAIPFRDSTMPAAVAGDTLTPDDLGEMSVLGAGLVVPVRGVLVTQLRDTYGDPRTGHVHEALDIMAPRGTEVLSATSGRLLKLFSSVPGGIMVYAADSSDRFILMYGHLERYADGLVEGMPLTRGQVIGYVGSTGNVAPGGPHLHFAIARGQPSVKWWKGEPVNPYTLFVPPARP